MEDAYKFAEQVWVDSGVEPPWWRVYRNGHDVTDDPVASWPALRQRYYAEGWRPHSGPNADPPSPPGPRPMSKAEQYAARADTLSSAP